MRVIAILFILFCGVNTTKFILPDSKIYDVPAPEDFLYHLKIDDSPLLLDRLYILSGNYYDSSLMCPKGYFIAEMHQELIVNSSQERILNFQHHAAVGNMHSDIKSIPCPPIYECLGYQACFFEFPSSLCFFSLNAGLLNQSASDFLLLTIICMRDDDSTFEQIKLPKNQVLNMFYESNEFWKTDDFEKSMLQIKHLEWKETDIFDVHCPHFESDLFEKQYFGECPTPPSSRKEMKLWTLLGRAHSLNCIFKLRQVFCAYQMNEKGLCIPIIYNNTDTVGNHSSKFPENNFQLNMNSYNKFLFENHASMIPSRLAFIIFIHDDISSASELLRLVYRKEFLYILHVDKKVPSLWKNLQQHILHNYAYENVFLHSSHESFGFDDSSYEFVQALLQGFSQLLYLGIWDFVINLDEKHFPVNSVEDLALELSKHRGFSFVSDFQQVKPESFNQNPVCGCDGFDYNISLISRSFSKDLSMHTASEWGVFSRNFIDYLLNRKLHADVIKKYQFYLQTDQNYKNRYLPTVLMHSPFREFFHISSIHINIKPEFTNGKFYTHFETDVPNEDESDLFTLSHTTFFVYIPSSYENLRTYGMNYLSSSKDQFYRSMLPEFLLRFLCEDAVNNIPSLKEFKINSLEKVQIIPSLLPHDMYCRNKEILSLNNIVDNFYWFDIFLIHENGSGTGVRLKFEAHSHRSCFRQGHIKMVFLSTWLYKNDRYAFLNRFSMNASLPVPFAPAYSTSIGITVVFNNNWEGQKKSPSDTEHKMIIKFSLMKSGKFVGCIKDEILTMKSNGMILEDKCVQKNKDFIKCQFSFDCGELDPGNWTVRITKLEPHPVSNFDVSFYLVDVENMDIFYKQLKNITALWKFKDFLFLSSDMLYSYKEDELKQRKDFFSETIANHKVVDEYTEKYTESNIGRKPNLDMQSIKVLLISTGVISIILCIFLYILFSSRRLFFRYLFTFIVLIAISIVLQIILISLYIEDS